MPHRQATAFLTLILIALLLSVSGCCCCSLCGPGTGRFVFLEHYTNVTAKIIEGSDPYTAPVPSVKYGYNESTNKLQLLFPEDFYYHYAGLKIFYGDSAMAYGHGDVDFGGHSDYHLISRLPFESDRIKIVGVDGDGTVHFSYCDQEVVLRPGESWSGDVWATNETDQGRNGSVLLNVTRVDTFTNYGLLDLTSLTF